MEQFKFTFKNIKDQFRQVLDAGYQVMTCEEYVHHKKTGDKRKVLVNRVDIDYSVKKVERLVMMFNQLKIKATFFLRLHAPEYNPFSFENYRIVKHLIASGHELGYHSEVMDQSLIWNENAADCLIRDIAVMNRIFGIQIKGVASHGGLTGLNNLDFWKDKKPSDFNLSYEAYDQQPGFNLFNESFYISDSEWIRWKCYNTGALVKNDMRPPSEHIKENHRVIYLLTHPDTYFDNHFYEDEK